MNADPHIAAHYEEQFAADRHGEYFSGQRVGFALDGLAGSKDVTVTLTAFTIRGNQLADWIAFAKYAQSSHTCEISSATITCTTDTG